MRFSSFFPPLEHRDRPIDDCAEHIPGVALDAAHQDFPAPPEEGGIYDYVICGAGTAGCVLAHRLSSDRSKKVLVLERGTFISDIIGRIPFMSSLRLVLGFYGTKLYTKPQAELRGRTPDVWVGRMVGGGSAVNCTIYTRGSFAEFDDWNVAGWTGKDLEPYLNRAERFNPLNKDEKSLGHGYDGLWFVRATKPMFGFSQYFLDGMHALGVKQTEDPHAVSGTADGPVATGAWNLQVSQKPDGTRSHTGSAYLSDEILQARPNLQLVVNADTHHVHLEGSKGKLTAKGVWIVQNKKMFYVKARHVILSSGAVFSPAILQRSGIGPSPLLKELNIKSLVDSPGVGRRLKDHVVCLLHFRLPKENSLMRLARPTTALATIVKGAWEYFRHGQGWMTTAMAVESMAYFNSEDIEVLPGHGPGSVRVVCKDTRSKAPDIEISMEGMWSDASTPMYYGLDAAKYGVASFLVYNAKPKSTGEVSITSRNPEDKPVIDPKLLTAEDDMRRLILAVRFALSLAATMRHELDFDFGPASVPGWDSKKGGWTDAKEALLPPSSFGKASPADRAFDFVDPAALSDETIREFIRDIGMCVQHMQCTAAMGEKGSSLAGNPAVVDNKTLKVHGVDDLHVCDASVIPNILAVHPQAAIVAIAEKAAEAILAADDS